MWLTPSGCPAAFATRVSRGIHAVTGDPEPLRRREACYSRGLVPSGLWIPGRSIEWRRARGMGAARTTAISSPGSLFS
jgi:hypothetical protein